MQENNILYLVDEQGHIKAVQLSEKLWAEVKDQVLKAEQKFKAPTDPFSKPEPLDALAELKHYWDFRYPYEPHMRCDHCGVSTDDWENDPAHPFHLLNANFGGLLVVICKQCGAHIRKKHFRDHFVFECTPIPKI